MISNPQKVLTMSCDQTTPCMLVRAEWRHGIKKIKGMGEHWDPFHDPGSTLSSVKHGEESLKPCSYRACEHHPVRGCDGRDQLEGKRQSSLPDCQEPTHWRGGRRASWITAMWQCLSISKLGSGIVDYSGEKLNIQTEDGSNRLPAPCPTSCTGNREHEQI
jgi:hypothetical protein